MANNQKTTSLKNNNPSAETSLLPESVINKFFQMSSDMLGVFNSEGYFLEMNPAWENLLGYTREELLSKPFIEFVHHDDVERTLKEYEEQLKGKDVFKFRNRYICKNDAIKWLEWHGIASKDRTLVYAVTRDITGQYEFEERLKHSEIRMRTIFEEAPMGIALIDSYTGEIYEANHKFAEIIGRTKEELKNVDWMAITHPDDVQEDLDNMTLLNAGKLSSFRMEKRYIHKDGSWVWINMTIAPLLWDKKGNKNHLCMIEDITERKILLEKLKESEQLFSGMFESHNAVKLLIDPETLIIMDANDAAAEFYGYPREVLKTMSIPDINILNTAEIRKQMDTAAKNKYSLLNFTHRLSSGELRDIEAHAGFIQISNRQLLFAIIHDITEKNLAQKALKESEEQLIKSITDKDKLFSIIAHDLRGPMGNYMQMTKLLYDEIETMEKGELVEGLRLLKDSSAKLFELLEDLLTWSRFQKGVIELKPEEFFIRDEISQSLEILLEATAKKGISLKYIVADNLKVHSDKKMFNSIIRNLISNAIKFTQHGGCIMLSAEENSKDETEIHISDTGIGMSPELIKDLFNIAVDTGRRGTEGESSSGLGLVLCKEFSEMNNGRIEVTSREGKGSTFTVILPSKKV